MNEYGSITHYTIVAATIGGYEHQLRLLVTSLGKEDIILGLPWLRRINPIVNFAEGTINVDPTRVQISLIDLIWRKKEPPRQGTAPIETDSKQVSKEQTDSEQVFSAEPQHFKPWNKDADEPEHPEPEEQDKLLSYL